MLSGGHEPDDHPSTFFSANLRRATPNYPALPQTPSNNEEAIGFASVRMAQPATEAAPAGRDIGSAGKRSSQSDVIVVVEELQRDY